MKVRVAAGTDALVKRLKEFIAAGASELVVDPIQEPQLDMLAASVLATADLIVRA